MMNTTETSYAAMLVRRFEHTQMLKNVRKRWRLICASVGLHRKQNNFG